MAQEKIVINCGDSLTVYHAAALHKKIITAINSTSTVELLGNSIAKVDSVGLQLIAVLADELNRVGGKLLWNKPSQVLIDSSNTLGMYSSIGLE